MVDATRDNNPIGYYNADTNDAYQDYAHYDLLSNGFKLRSGDVYENGNDERILFSAFATNPFKYSNAH